MTRVFSVENTNRNYQAPVPPLPSAVGLNIFENISEKAWKEWQNNQTMLINEHRLSLMDPDVKFLTQEMHRFLIAKNMQNLRDMSTFKLTAFQYFCSIRGLLLKAR